MLPYCPDLFPRGPSRLDDLPGHEVCVDDGNAELEEHLADRALSRGHAAGQPHQEHVEPARERGRGVGGEGGLTAAH